MHSNPAQEEAVRTINGPLIIISCPGSGKTTTLIRRINNMVECGIPEKTILVVTFTGAAAAEMEQRYIKEYGRGNGVTFKTIHSLCFLILKECTDYRQEHILTGAQQREFFVKLVKQDIEINDPNEFAIALITEMSSIRNNQISLEACEVTSCSKQKFKELVLAYSRYKKENHRIDYDDMLVFALAFLKRDSRILKKWQERYQHIMCDEYQDTNYVQRDILYLLSGKYGNLCVVGDDDQSIYGFRGAHPEIMLNFRKDFPGCKEIYMNTNYRSRPEIIRAAKELIGYNTKRFEKDILPYRKEGGRVVLSRTGKRTAQVKKLVEKIKELSRQGTDYQEMAVLFRVNKQMKLCADEFMRQGIPFYSTEALQDVYSHWIFRDIMAYYRTAHGRGSKDDIRQILNRPNRWLTDSLFQRVSFTREDLLTAAETVTGMEEWKKSSIQHHIVKLFDDLQCMKEKHPGEFMNFLNIQVDYPKYLQAYGEYRNIDGDELLEIFQTYEQDAGRYESFEEWGMGILQYQKHLNQKKKDSEHRGVVLSTMHKAKGLEWDVVFLTDCQEGIVPYKLSMNTKDKLEEERRLFYVAVTRAREQLYLYTCEKSESGDNLEASRFISELTGEKRRMLENLRELEQRKREKAEKKRAIAKQMNTFSGCENLDSLMIIGQTVVHKTFGYGIIEDYSDEYVVISFQDRGTKRFLKKFLEQNRLLRDGNFHNDSSCD